MSCVPNEQHRVQVEALGITRLVAAEARAQGLAPDRPETDAIHEQVVAMAHHERVLRLYRLGGDRTDDLWMRFAGCLDDLLPADGEAVSDTDGAGDVVGDVEPPRLVGMFGDVYDESGTNVSWGLVRWALRLPSGGALTFTAASASSATLWLSLADAVESFDNPWVASLDPKPLSHWWSQPW